MISFFSDWKPMGLKARFWRRCWWWWCCCCCRCESVNVWPIPIATRRIINMCYLCPYCLYLLNLKLTSIWKWTRIAACFESCWLVARCTPFHFYTELRTLRVSIYIIHYTTRVWMLDTIPRRMWSAERISVAMPSDAALGPQMASPQISHATVRSRCAVSTWLAHRLGHVLRHNGLIVHEVLFSRAGSKGRVDIEHWDQIWLMNDDIRHVYSFVSRESSLPHWTQMNTAVRARRSWYKLVISAASSAPAVPSLTSLPIGTGNTSKNALSSP